MPPQLLTAEGHHRVLARLVALAETAPPASAGSSGELFPHLIHTFLTHQLVSSRALLQLIDSAPTAFPVVPGYLVARSMFEADVTAHYIAIAPDQRAEEYLGYQAVLAKRRMEACRKHRASVNPSWRDGMAYEWEHYWASREASIDNAYAQVRARYERTSATGAPHQFTNWSGLSLRKMAEALNHTEAYDVFYSELCSFAHVDVRLAAHYATPTALGQEVGLGFVLRYAAIFLTCYLTFYAGQVSTWPTEAIERCWRRGGV